MLYTHCLELLNKRTKISGLETKIFGLKMTMKSGLEFERAPLDITANLPV